MAALAVVAGTVVIIVTLVYYYFTRNFGYWLRKGVPFARPTFFFGNTKDQLLFRASQAECMQAVYEQLEGHPFGGYFDSATPVLMLRDPEVIKQILVKDFWHFPGRGMAFDAKRDPLTGHLFNYEGMQWRNLRVKLTPTFTSGKMRRMFTLLEDCVQRMLDRLSEVVGPHHAAYIDIREVCCNFTIDVIGACAFGLNAKALDDPESEFRRIGRIAQVPPGAWLRRTLRSVAPWLLRPLRMRVFDDAVTAFFRGLVRAAAARRAAAAAVGAPRRPDFMQLLLDLREGAVGEGENGKGDDGDEGDEGDEGGVGGEGLVGVPATCERVELTEDQLAAQVFLFFFAGFETSSLTMTFALYELAMNHEIQDLLREEVDETLNRHNNKISYNALQEMTYLDQVVQETLRKYPPVANLTRICRKEYALPGGVRLPAGARVTVPVFAIQRDPRHFAEPLRFRPQRFAAGAGARPPPAHLPFGAGPRVRLGSRFGLMQVKMGIALLIAKFLFEICSDTPDPLVLNPMTAATSPIGKLQLKMSYRSCRSL